MDLVYDDMGHYGTAGAGANGNGGSPVEGSVSGDGADDHPSALGLTTNGANGAAGGMVVGMNVLGKPMGTNNFVTKLYQWVSRILEYFALSSISFFHLSQDDQ